MSSYDRRARVCVALCVSLAAASCAERGGPEPEDARPPDGGRRADAGSTRAGDGGRDGGSADASLDDEAKCGALALVQEKCATCHGEEPSSGAPIPLVSAQDFQVDVGSDDEQRVHALALLRLNDEDAPMPPADAEPLAAAERRLLESWLRDGAPAAEGDCDEPEQEEAR